MSKWVIVLNSFLLLSTSTGCVKFESRDTDVTCMRRAFNKICEAHSIQPLVLSFPLFPQWQLWITRYLSEGSVLVFLTHHIISLNRFYTTPFASSIMTLLTLTRDSVPSRSEISCRSKLSFLVEMTLISTNFLSMAFHTLFSWHLFVFVCIQSLCPDLNIK